MGRLGQEGVGQRFEAMVLISALLFLSGAEAAGWGWDFGLGRPLAEDTGKLPSAQSLGEIERGGVDHHEVLKEALREKEEKLRELEGQIRMANAEIQILRGGGGDVPNGAGGGQMLPRRDHDARTGDEDKDAERADEVNELQRALAASKEETALAESKLSTCQSEAEEQARESKEAVEDVVKSRDVCEGNRSSCASKVELLEAEAASAKEICSGELGSLAEALNLCVKASESDGGDGALARSQAVLKEVAEELAECKLGEDVAKKAERRAMRAAKRAQEEEAEADKRYADALSALNKCYAQQRSSQGEGCAAAGDHLDVHSAKICQECKELLKESSFHGELFQAQMQGQVDMAFYNSIMFMSLLAGTMSMAGFSLYSIDFSRTLSKAEPTEPGPPSDSISSPMSSLSPDQWVRLSSIDSSRSTDSQ